MSLPTASPCSCRNGGTSRQVGHSGLWMPMRWLKVPFGVTGNDPHFDITPNGDDPRKILIDLAHTYAIQGWGKDYLASAIVFLSVHCGVWGTHGDYKSKLDRAWGSFKSWCVSNRKTKIKSYLVNIVHFSCSKCVLV